MLCVAAALMFIALVSKSWVGASMGSRDVKVNIGPLGAEACMGSMCRDAPTGKLPGDVELVMMLALISGFASVAAAGVLGGMTLANKRDKIPFPPKLAQIAFGLAAFSFVFFVIRIFSEGGSDLAPGWAMFPGVGGAIVAGIGLKKLTPHLSTSAPAHAGAYGQAAYGGQPPAQQSQPMQPYGQPYGRPGPQAYSQPAAQQSQPMQPYGQQPYGQPAQQSQPMQPYGQPQMQAPHVPPPQQQAAPNCPRCGQPLQFVAQYQRWFCAREQQYV